MNPLSKLLPLAEGPPPNPQANGVEYVCLVTGWGWAMVTWHPDRGFSHIDQYGGHHPTPPERIRYWMPQSTPPF
jgi:hypothetical protein